jgi:TetR/AcrR family acrAB operon transcriptional repressor
MARKTKEEAELTRSRILDAAEQVFHAQGVSASSLQDIAQAAGVTRGAVYWHFEDKTDVFNAMMERVCLPFEASGEALEQAEPAQALRQLRQHWQLLFESTVADAQVQRVLTIATSRVEYNDDLKALRDRKLQWQSEHVALLERALGAARKAGDIGSGTPLKQAAMGLHALLDGLLQNWLLQPGAFDLKRTGLRVLDVYLTGLKG